MKAQDFINTYGIEHARFVLSTSNLWDTYYSPNKKEWSTHQISDDCVCLTELEQILSFHKEETSPQHDRRVVFGLLAIFWLVIIWWVL